MEHKGTVYFFTGLSGAGKTTVGSLFYRRLKNTKPNAVYLDGDEIRVAFGEDVGYTNDERLRWAGRIFRVCKLLSDQGIDVVCCSIAMYQSVRAWNRANIPNYKEIYLRVKPETLLARNQKGLYTGGHNVVGVDHVDDETMSGLPVPSLCMLVASASMEQEIECMLRLNPHMEFVIYTLDFPCAASIPALFQRLGIGETEVIQIAVSKLTPKHTFETEPAPWLICGRA